MLTNETVKHYVENSNLVSVKTFDKFEGVSLLKYKNKVFYDNLWDDFLIDMRGTVVSEDYSQLVMPLRKIFNRGENGVDIDLDEEVIAVRKVNGFMFALTYIPEVDRILPSTTGSLDSEFIDRGLKYVTKELAHKIKAFYINSLINVTWIFEVVSPDDPHIIPEQEGLYLLEMREVAWNGGEVKDQELLDELAEIYQVKRPEWFKAKFGDIVKDLHLQKHEGFVVHSNNVTLKLKSPFYLTTKFLGRMKDEKFTNWLETGVLKEELDEEFYPLIDVLEKDKEKFLTFNQQERISFIREFLNDK
jgi:hypothetical protein